jgi:Zn-dependent peptidase ImmA (M78 family)
MLVCSIGKTYRQKYQRAFAQELLCPYSALVSWLNTVQPNEEAISQAAEYFSVSPLLVQTVLVNKGHLPSSHLLSNY